MTTTRQGDDRIRTADLRWRAETLARRRLASLARELDHMPPENLRQAVHDLQVHQIELELQNDELRLVQDRLETARARYFDIYDLAPMGYLILAENGRILESNRAAAEMLGEAQATLVKQPISRFILDADQDIYYMHRKRFLQTGAFNGCELRLRNREGTSFWASLAMIATCAPNATQQPAACGTLSYRMVLSDITERKRVEALLGNERAMLRMSQRQSHLGTWVWDLRCRTMSWTEETYRLLDCEPSASMAGMEPLERSLEWYLPEDRPIIQAANQRCAESCKPYDLKFQVVTPKGRRFWSRSMAEAERENGEMVRVVGLIMELPGRVEDGPG